MDRIQKSRKFAEECLEGIDSAHGLKHAETTANFAKLISEKENVDKELCVIAALLHDIGRNKDGKWKKETVEDNHGVDSAKKARHFLFSLGLSNEEINEICEAISQHCFPNIQTNRISKILWDSDKLNMFSKEMKSEYIKCWKDKGWSDEKIAEQIKKEREFYLQTFHTEIARKIARDNLHI
jgi:putative nucleotidyltransferase with HDIG domain